MKQRICKAFCDDLIISETDSGFAIGTPYEDVHGDVIGFYAMGPNEEGRYRIIDNGTTIAFIEAAGASLDIKSRMEALNSLLDEYDAAYDEDRGELSLSDLGESDLPRASLKFMALLLRIKDLLFTTKERAENTFREEVIKELRGILTGRASIRENEAISAEMSEVIPDLVMRATDRDPVALFIGTSDQKVNDAIHLHMIATHQLRTPVQVIAMLEIENAITQKLRQRADNRLDAVPRYRRDEAEALNRVVREVVGSSATVSQLH